MNSNSFLNETIDHECYKMVVNAILNINLNRHLEKISKFVSAFKSRDTTNKGEITEVQFKEMVIDLKDDWSLKDAPTDPTKKIMFH